jgi:hypothetical protein
VTASRHNITKQSAVTSRLYPVTIIACGVETRNDVIFAIKIDSRHSFVYFIEKFANASFSEIHMFLTSIFKNVQLRLSGMSRVEC